MKNSIFKKICAGTAALTLCLTAAAPVSADTVKGDADANGVVQVQDVIALKSHLLNTAPLSDEGMLNADMNEDETVNVVDLILLTNVFLSSKNEQSSDAVKITLSGTEITADEGVETENTTVKITKSGTYTVSGEMTTDAVIYVNVPDEDKESINITLDGVSMTNSTNSPCIMVENADKTKITFKGENKLVSTYGAADADSAVIYAKDDITFTKSSDGKLEIESDTQMGIYCNNDIKFNGGKIKIKTDAADLGTAKADGVKAKGDIELTGGELKINASGDGLKSSKAAVTVSGGSAEIKAGNDAIQAETSFTMTDGDVVACGDRGLTALAEINVTEGNLFVTSTEAFSFPAKTGMDRAFIITLKEQHAKTDLITLCGTTLTPLKKYQYVLAFDTDFKASSNYTDVLVINGEAYDTSGGVLKESSMISN